MNSWLTVHGKNNVSFGLPLPNGSLLENWTQQRDEMNHNEYDLVEERQKGLEMLSMSNPEHLLIIKTIMHKLYPHDNEWIINDILP